MNKENLRKLIETIRESETFDMKEFTKCGTPACIAGHATMLLGKNLNIVCGYEHVYNLAEFLQISNGFAREIALGKLYVNNASAAEVIEYLEKIPAES